MTTEGELMLTAPPGEDCNGIYYGGAGYSGGGGVRALTGDRSPKISICNCERTPDLLATEACDM